MLRFLLESIYRQFLLFFSTIICISTHVFGNTEPMPTIYITIDDAPSNEMNQIIDLVKEEKVPITLFLIGKHIEANETNQIVYRKVLNDPYIFIANHSYSHANGRYRKFYSSGKAVLEDMKKNNEILGFKEAPFYSRLPGRSVFRLPSLHVDDPYITPSQTKSEKEVYDLLAKNGFFIYGWDLEWEHKTSEDPIQSAITLMVQIRDQLAKKETKVANHIILLMHDEMFCKPFKGKIFLKQLIKLLKQEGYNFSTINHYPL